MFFPFVFFVRLGGRKGYPPASRDKLVGRSGNGSVGGRIGSGMFRGGFGVGLRRFVQRPRRAGFWRTFVLVFFNVLSLLFLLHFLAGLLGRL